MEKNNSMIEIENLLKVYDLLYNIEVLNNLNGAKNTTTVELDYSFTRLIDNDVIKRNLFDLIYCLYTNTYYNLTNCKDDNGVYKSLECLFSTFTVEKQDEYKLHILKTFNLPYSNRLSFKKILVKSKDTLKKYCRYGMEKEFERLFNETMDALTEKKFNKTLTLSNELKHFLSMSYGSGWSSCHELDNDYASGNIGLYLDNITWVICRDNKNTPLLKHFRILCHVNNNCIAFNRSYGFISKQEREAIENTVVNFFQQFKGIEYCNKIASYDAYNKFFYKSSNYTGYFDLPRSEYNYYYNQSFTETRDNVGTYPVCLLCGEKHKTGSLYCRKCNGYEICSHCNNEVHNDYTIYHDDEVYCEYCYNELFSSCDCCGEVIAIDDLTRVGNGDYVCESCIDDSYFSCAGCEEITPIENSDSIIVDGQCYCNNCYEYL